MSEMADVLTGYVASDDLANWQGQGFDEYDVPDKWMDLYQGGRKIGRVRLRYDRGWRIDLDGQGQPFTLKDPNFRSDEDAETPALVAAAD